MFKNFKVELTGPLCNCAPKQDLAFSTGISNKGDLTIILVCRACGIQLSVPIKSIHIIQEGASPIGGLKESVPESQIADNVLQFKKK